MKNFKKVIALGSAVMMSLTMGVSAFAATASYEGGFVKLADIDGVINAENQWTVVVIDAAKQNDTLAAEDLYYINQGTSGDAFWTDGMGTKVELTEGDYIVRIGGETLTQVEEIPFSISTTPEGVQVIWGDVDLSTVVDANDAGAVLDSLIGGNKIYGDYTIGEAFVGTTLWGDVDLSGVVDANDAGAVLDSLIGGNKVYGDYTIGEESLVK